jgi:hypothetical protein
MFNARYELNLEILFMLIFVLQGVILVVNDSLYDFVTGVAFEWGAILFRIL